MAADDDNTTKKAGQPTKILGKQIMDLIVTDDLIEVSTGQWGEYGGWSWSKDAEATIGELAAAFVAGKERCFYCEKICDPQDMKQLENFRYCADCAELLVRGRAAKLKREADNER